MSEAASAPGHEPTTPKETRLLQCVLQRARPNDPESMINTIDSFCTTDSSNWMMNVGPEKGKILDETIRKRDPLVMFEFGTYCGYSATRASRLLRPGARLFSFELSPFHASIAEQVLGHAGLLATGSTANQGEQPRGPTVTVVQGAVSAELLAQVRRDHGLQHVDLVFIDHDKKFYKRDLILLEQSGLLTEGSVLVADNVIYPGAPDYLEYVRNERAAVYRSTFHPCLLEYRNDIADGVEVSVAVADPTIDAHH